MTAIFIVAGLLIIIYLLGRVNIAMKFGRQVDTLFGHSKFLIDQSYHHTLLEGLPAPVQRYFRHIIKDGQSYISYARILHKGKFKTGINKSWINIHGEQYATTQNPGFIWKGDTSLFTARDMYISNKGKLIVTLFSLCNIENEEGSNYDEGELLRWLAESVLYPTNLLPSPRLTWSAVNDHSAKITFTHLQLSPELLVTFNEQNEITQMEAQRYMGKGDTETWVINLSDYKEINEVLVPTAFEVLWRLKEGDFSYAKFILQKLEYDQPAHF